MQGSDEAFLEDEFWEMFFKNRRDEVSRSSRALEFLPEPDDVSEVVMFQNPPMEIFDYNHTKGVKMRGGLLLGFRCYRLRVTEAVKIYEKELEEERKLEELKGRMEDVKVEEVSRNKAEEQAGKETQDQVLARIRASDRKRRKEQGKQERKKARGRDQ